MYYLKKEKLFNINDLGQKTIEFIFSFFNNKSNINIIKEMIKSGVRPEYVKMNIQDNELKNKNIVFTGILQTLNRRSAKELVQKFGAKIQSTVSKNTDILVAGSEPGSKLKKAEELNIKILNENELIKIIS